MNKLGEEEEEPVRKRFDFIVRYVEFHQVGQIDFFGEKPQFVVRQVKIHNLLPLPNCPDGGVN